MKILVAEDDQYIREGIVEILQTEGYNTIIANDGQEAIDLFADHKPDFVLLDIMMPEIDGYEVCKRIRKTDEHIPVIFISAKSEEIDKVIGLELGADDFIVKPFGTREVIARIRAITRRCLAKKQDSVETPKQITMKDLAIFPNELRAQRGGKYIELSLRDINVLSLLFKMKGKVVSRDDLFNECWGRDYLPNSRTLDQHISKLRKQIELDPKDPKIIQTVHGAGYRFDG
ncbi:MAG: DNA-binding response regulator [Gammaproteobacteria bacterium]|nr:MAG: DNA-binding response regulator [Gammaproteobacteria bacterium]